MDLTLLIEPSNVDSSGIKRTPSGFAWVMSHADAGRFSAQIKELADAGIGHTYLDAADGADEVQVMVSIGEYPCSIFDTSSKQE
jgi:hypothetical protein